LQRNPKIKIIEKFLSAPEIAMKNSILNKIISFLYNGIIKINESSLLLVVISIYLEFTHYNFETLINWISFLMTIYVFLFNIKFIRYCLSNLNSLENSEINWEYLLNKFDELNYDQKYSNLNT
jgi:hypothetical protein